jgi:hypothetical protein
MDKIIITQSDVDFYFELVTNSKSAGRNSNFIDSYKGLINLRTELDKKKCSFEFFFVDLIIKYFEKIIKMSPRGIEIWCDYIDKRYRDKFYLQVGDKIKSTKFTEKIIDALGYKKLQEKELKLHFKSKGINTCVYCNCQYTLNFKNSKKEASNYQIDHIFPKSKYPFFSISIHNLVPSCASCNLNKGSINLSNDKFCHPYIESFGELFFFTINEDINKLSSIISKEDELKIELTNKDHLKVKSHDELFDLSGIYTNFSNVTAEILELARVLPTSKRNDILSNFNSENAGSQIIPDVDTLDRIILRVYPNSKAHNERPLSKFINDIARYGGYFSK